MWTPGSQPPLSTGSRLPPEPSYRATLSKGYRPCGEGRKGRTIRRLFLRLTSYLFFYFIFQNGQKEWPVSAALAALIS